MILSAVMRVVIGHCPRVRVPVFTFLHVQTNCPASKGGVPDGAPHSYSNANPDHSCFGRDHAHQRIDLYPVEGQCPRTTIAIHVSRSLKGAGSDQTTTGLQRAIDLPGRRPALPYQRQALEYWSLRFRT
jgi:hypothetical protein